MVAVGILSSPFFTNVILPFLLIFVIVYAILDKTKILGDKRDINAVVSLVFALATVGLPSAFGAVDIIIKLIPVISVIMVIILAFMLTYGFVGGTKAGALSDPWHVFFAILIGLSLLGAVAWATGLLGMVSKTTWAFDALQSFILLTAIIAVVAIVTSGGGKKEKEKEE
jgi:phosphoglycerol transferase MdoB-like AlkP superfamily enzyme